MSLWRYPAPYSETEGPDDGGSYAGGLIQGAALQAERYPGRPPHPGARAWFSGSLRPNNWLRPTTCLSGWAVGEELWMKNLEQHFNLQCD